MTLTFSQLIFCTRKISRIKRGMHKHIKFRLFKHYSADLYKEIPTSINFPNYQNSNDATEAYDDLKSLGLPKKISSCEVSTLKVNKTI